MYSMSNVKLARLYGFLLVLALCCAAAAGAPPGAKSSKPARFPVPTLDPTTIPKYVDQLVIPPVMPQADKVEGRGGKKVDYYEIAVRQFQQQILPVNVPTPYPSTTVWSYGAESDPATFNYPAFTIEATVDRPVRVKWINELVDANGNYLPHLLPVDQTVHWANPGGLKPDSEGMVMDPYTGPVPIVTHVHGAHVTQESDGYPEAWYLPAAKNIPQGYFAVGDKYAQYKKEAQKLDGVKWEPGSATFTYPNDQLATTLWYHDHALGITRLNVYAGPAGFYLLRGGDADLETGLPGPAPKAGDPAGTKYYEIPIVIQDRSFNTNGSLFFPTTREYFDGIVSSYIGDVPPGDISPIYNSEFFGNTIIVNGKTWPNLNVEPRRYRFRLLDGCNARSLKLKLVTGDATTTATRQGTPALPFWQIGAEQGFLPAPAKLDQLLVSLAERADVIVDFTGMAVGTKITMINLEWDAPLNAPDNPDADPATTGQVMQFTVVPLASTDSSIPPAQLQLPAIQKLGDPVRSRQVSLNEVEIIGRDANGGFVDGPKQAFLGIMQSNNLPMALTWDDPITENPTVGDTEIWEIENFTEDAHPIHLHLVHFEVVDRTPMNDAVGGVTSRPPEAWETGFKDTVVAYPEEITRIKAKFDIAGLYVWHCHIIDHEDNEMMRPYQVMPLPKKGRR